MADDFNWDDLPQNPGDPMAGSDYTDVSAYTPQFEIPDYSDANNIWGDGLPEEGGSVVQKILAGLKNKPKSATTLADLASMMGKFASGQQNDRYARGNSTQGYDRLMLDAQGDRNKNESDALKKLSQTSYIMGGGSQFKPATFQLNGQTRTAPDLGYGPSPTTDAEKQGASALQSQLQARLSPGGSYTPTPLDTYAKPGLAENIGTYGAAATSGLGSILDGLGGGGEGVGGSGSGGQSGSDGVGSTISGISKGIGTAASLASLFSKFGGGGSGAASGASGAAGAGGLMSGVLGKAVPIAGAVTGAYGLAKNQSVGSDVMSGMGAGASLGSFGGPIGTVVGAGVGALVGALRGAFSVTGKEHGGRDTQAQITANLSKLSTPQQRAEAAKAGWPDPNQALSLIVMRDKLLQSGLPGPQAEAQAESIMHGMWDGEKSGSSAVAKAASPLQGLMGPNFSTAQAPTGAGGSGNTPYPVGTDAFSRNARV